MGDDLPFIDEHREHMGAPPDRVWIALAGLFGSNRSTRALAQALRTEPRRAHGRPLAEGSSSFGFAVSEAEPGRLARLTGRHLFSRYELRFVLEEQSGGTLVRALSFGVFPGPHGWLYRQAVIGSRMHRVVVRRMLERIRRRAEREPAA
jgi:hypothetical protein